jgi:hypothetical protein
MRLGDLVIQILVFFFFYSAIFFYNLPCNVLFSLLVGWGSIWTTLSDTKLLLLSNGNGGVNQVKEI